MIKVRLCGTTQKFVYPQPLGICGYVSFEHCSEMTYHTQHNPGFKRHIPNFYYLLYPTHVSFIELEQKIDLNRQPWFTSFLVQQTQTQITQPEFPKKKKKTPTTLHHTTVYTQPPNHPIPSIHIVMIVHTLSTQHTKQLCGRRYILQNLFYVYDSEL